MADDCVESLEATINETLRLLMTRTGGRQVDVAEVLGITQSSMSHRLQGYSTWKVDDLAKVAAHFGLTASELISGYTAIGATGRLPAARARTTRTRTRAA
ncbi:helix-turn-helix domain-containing protein [Candidatus Frankia alpina]|uniref:XRE family transcriptional regulator n=1 Tax=Candidatus Frankia alpina TaxID=2699483 RepID=A0A4S5E059_9ACTN|nr:helix-turn-helix transcriptional regulator [Candidatus Frankia alpina]THJ64686.1 XRE family transcriptional regulator [Candidatus Frankia alpina]